MGPAAATPPRVLVVEDQTLLGIYIGDLLADMGCEAVGPFSSVATVVPTALKDRLDAALLDVYLADESVEPVAQILDRRGIPYAFITAYGRGHLPANLQDRPYLNKPFTDGEIEALVNAMLGGGPRPGGKSGTLGLSQNAKIASPRKLRAGRS
jgi:two-component SAPR family response regulator